MSEFVRIDKNNIPAHIAIIMDGNGRWAKIKGKDRTYGHYVGAERVLEIISEADNIGVKYLTLYTFSTENWKRPKEEVNALMGLLTSSISVDKMNEGNVRFKVIGDKKKLPQKVRDSLSDCELQTANNSGLTLVLALSYSSKWEITEAARKIAVAFKEGRIKEEDITEELFAENLETNFMPDPDLLIRTGGEIRLSNYLLWQCAYSELYYCKTFWPDFDKEELHKAIFEYQKRERRFGKTSEQLT